MGKNAAYAAQYAEEAKEQMRMYGIPASVILAQAILESSNGQSQLSRECNNHFGIKATASWLKNGGSNAQFKQKQRKVNMRGMNCKWLRMSNIS